MHQCCCVVSSDFFFFFFKQKTAYEMRISDWSSDVCSSDLEEIATFCSTTYDVSFPIFSKISVAGEDKHPFYAELIRSAPSAQPDGGAAMREKLSGFGLAPNPAPEIPWTFHKFLVGRTGQVAARFAPNVAPADALAIHAHPATPYAIQRGAYPAT